MPSSLDPKRSFLAVSFLLLASFVVLSCSKKQETASTTNESGSTGAAKIHVDQIVLGREMTADRRVITVDNTTFTPGDTVFAAVTLAAPTPAVQLVGRWKAPDGTVVYETTEAVLPSDTPTAVTFYMVKPSGLPPGTYTLEVLDNGQVVGTKEVTIVAPK
jgi:hypothetical protein